MGQGLNYFSGSGVKYLSLVKVLKIAILAEKFALDYTWYVDIILNLIRYAGE